MTLLIQWYGDDGGGFGAGNWRNKENDWLKLDQGILPAPLDPLKGKPTPRVICIMGPILQLSEMLNT